jgi:S1-C subfamily serine protease
MASRAFASQLIASVLQGALAMSAHNRYVFFQVRSMALIVAAVVTVIGLHQDARLLWGQSAPPPPQPERPILHGMQIGASASGQPVVVTVYPNSPAAAAGIMPGDVVIEVGTRRVENSAQLTEELAGRKAGERITLRVVRNGQTARAELIADATLPVLADAPGAVKVDERAFGWALRDDPQQGVTIANVASGSAAARLGLRAGDVIAAVDGKRVKSSQQFSDMMAALVTELPGKEVPLTVIRAGDDVEVVLTMPQNRAAAPAATEPVAAPPSAATPATAPVLPREREDAGRLFGMVLRNTSAGVVVVDVNEGSPAAKAGILPGDTIVNIGKAEVDTFPDVVRAFDVLKPAPEVELRLAREGEPMTATLVIGTPRASVPEDLVADLTEQASHIVVGGVKAIYSFEQQTPDWQVSHRVAEVATANVEKGEGIEPGELMYVRYTVSKPTAGAAEAVYPNVRSTFRLFVRRSADGGYDLLLPGGAQIVENEQPVAAAEAPVPRTVLRPVAPPAGAVPAPVPVPAPATAPAPAPIETPTVVVPERPAVVAPPPRIEGTVVFGEAPQAAVQVDLWDAAGLVATTTTNAQGAFVFNVPAGRYQVSARGRIGNLIRVAPPITVFVPVDPQQRAVVRVPLP